MFKKGLDHFDWKATELVHFDNFVKGFAKWSEGETEVVVMVEWVNVPHKAFLIISVAGVDFFEDIFLDFGGLDVSIDGTNNLR